MLFLEGEEKERRREHRWRGWEPRQIDQSKERQFHWHSEENEAKEVADPGHAVNHPPVVSGNNTLRVKRKEIEGKILEE